MKKTNLFLSLAVVVFALAVLSSCKKDDEESKNPYYGKWESRVYPISLTAFEKMEFNFTNTTFEDKVSQGASATAITQVCAIKGDVVYTEPATIDAEINQVSVMGGAYVDKSTDPTTFATYFAASLGTRLTEQFQATYTFSNDTMILSIPMIGQSSPVQLRLTKVQ
jgi:hypothetical protein